MSSGRIKTDTLDRVALPWGAAALSTPSSVSISVLLNTTPASKYTFTDKSGYLRICGTMVKVEGIIPLQQFAVMDDTDLVRHSKGFKLVVGHQDDGDAVPLEDCAAVLGRAAP